VFPKVYFYTFILPVKFHLTLGHMGPMYRLKEDTASQSSTFNRFKIRSFSRALEKRCSGSPKDLERKFHLNSTGRHRPRFPTGAEKVSPDTWRATGFRREQRDTNRVTASLLLRNWGESFRSFYETWVLGRGVFSPASGVFSRRDGDGSFQSLN